jgi:GNAT superfamily N-acetyltransferase
MTATPNAMIRHAVHQDTDAIADVRVAAIRELAVCAYSEEQVQAWLGNSTAGPFEVAAGSRVVLVEELNGVTRAFAQLDLEEGIVERVYVSPKHVRQGLGRRLLRALEAIAQEQGLTRLFIDATLNAVPFYASEGYTTVGFCKHELQGGVFFPCTAMVKELRNECVYPSIERTATSRLHRLASAAHVER